MRSITSLGLFGTALTLLAGLVAAQPAPKTKTAQPKGQYDPPAATKPDDATLKQIREKTEQLRKAVEGLKERKIPSDVVAEVEIHLKAAENIDRFSEWYHKDSGKWALLTLDRGLERARLAEGGKSPWRNVTGKWTVRAYRSEVDGSVQPYAVRLPVEFGKDPKKKWRLDVILHGRDGALTEAKFIASHDGGKDAAKDLNAIQLEVYGRGNNAYRWAGERDVFEAIADFQHSSSAIDPLRIVLRGFSMGGAGTWHLGLQHPGEFCVIGPGARFHRDPRLHR